MLGMTMSRDARLNIYHVYGSKYYGALITALLPSNIANAVDPWDTPLYPSIGYSGTIMHEQLYRTIEEVGRQQRLRLAATCQLELLLG